MAEKTADRVCQRLGLCQPCRTHMDPLPQTGDARWTEPGLTPSLWIRQNDPRDMLLCECEMVPTSVFDAIAELGSTINNLQLAVEACSADIKASCDEIEPGEGRLAQCLIDNKSKVSVPCQEAVDVFLENNP